MLSVVLPEVGQVFLIQIHILKPKVRVKKGYIEILTVESLYEGQNCDCALLSTKSSTHTFDLLFSSLRTESRPTTDATGQCPALRKENSRRYPLDERLSGP
jgi:hypothetical protein